MKNLLFFALCLNSITFCQKCLSQGWVAEIDLDFNHVLYGGEKITSATLTYSGITATGSSESSQLKLFIKGTGSPSGTIALAVSGIAFEPYDGSDPYTKAISATFYGRYNALCATGFFEADGATPEEHISVWIEIHPRLDVTYTQECNNVTLTSNTCSGSFLWELSESASGNYKIIPGKSSSSISMTRDEVAALGFGPYGRKYFRVTGLAGTTSQAQPVDLYYPAPSVIVIPAPPKCHDGTDGSIKVEISYSSPGEINDFVLTLFAGPPPSKPLIQEVLNNANTKIFSGLPAGNYWLRVQNNTNIATYGDCWSDHSVDPLFNPPAIAIPTFETSSYNGYPITCAGGTDGTLQVNPSGGSGTYTYYEWTPKVSTTDLATNLPQGNYKIRVRDSNDCWSGEYSQTLLAPQKLIVALTSIGGKNGYEVSCHDKMDGKMLAEISGGVSDYSSLWSNGETTPYLNGVGPGVYKVVVTDANGCRAEEQLTLTAPAPIDFIINEISGIRCAGDDTGILAVQATENFIGQLTYQWSTGETVGEVSGKTAGTYRVSVMDDQGCHTTRDHTLSEPIPFSVDIFPGSDFNGSRIRCYGEANGELITIVRTPGGTITSAERYTWYRDGIALVSGNTASELKGLTSGVYSVEIVYNTFCTTQNTFELLEPHPVTAVISTVSDYHGLPISCHGAADGIIKAKASGGTGAYYTYNWSDGASDSTLADIKAGNYVVIAKDINGCEGSAKKTLKDPEPVAAVISVLSNYQGQALSCFGAADAQLKVSAQGGVSPFRYVWATGDTTQSAAGLRAGNYLVTATDANGCRGINETTIVNPLQVTTKISQSDYNGFGVSCNGSADGWLQVDASGGTGFYEYSWNGHKAASPLKANLAADSYTIMVTDQNGCQHTVTEALTEPDVLQVQALRVKDVSCNTGSDGETQLQATGGAGFYAYSTFEIKWQPESSFRNLKAGEYQMFVKDRNDCTNSVRQQITEPAQMLIDFFDIGAALCEDPRGKVSASVSGGTGAYKYEWANSLDEVFSEQPNISGLMAGVYTLRIIDDHFCEAIRSIGITSTDGPHAKITGILPATCADSGDGSAVLDVTGGHEPYTVSWPDGQTTLVATNLGKGDYLVEIKDFNNCKIVEAITIPAPDLLQIKIIEELKPSCKSNCDGKLIVRATGGNGNYVYNWNDPLHPFSNNLCAGTYEVSVTDAMGCVATENFLLSEPDSLDINLKSTKPPTCKNGCNGSLEIETFGGTGKVQYEWSSGGINPLIDSLCSGSYTVKVIDANNCALTKTFTVEYPPQLEINLGDSLTLCEGQSHTLDPGPHWESYSWASNNGFKSSSQAITISDMGFYFLEAVNRNGCVARDTFFLETSTDLLKANFLVSTQAVAGDTVVIIDVSWPVPESARWTVPAEMTSLQNSGDIIYGQFKNPGYYEVSLTASLGGCRDVMTKGITVNKGEESLNDGRLGDPEFIKTFELFPNPNDGMFDVAIEFAEASPVRLTVSNTLNAANVIQIENSGAHAYLIHFDLRPVSSGSYTLRLEYSRGAGFLRFIVR
jgi:hypothetical protein